MTQLLFLKEFLFDPKAVGSVWPSHGALAQKMAENVVCKGDDCIVELGPGTGTITAALLKTGLNPGNMLLIEKSERLSDVLKDVFPQVHVMNRDALELRQAVQAAFGKKTQISTVVSSLPLRNFDSSFRKRLLQQVRDVLAPGGIFVQYTYALGTSQRLPGMELIKKQTVWRNIPPATISVHRRPVK